MVKRVALAAALMAALAGVARADAMDDELAACKALLMAGKADDAATRLAALETNAKSVTATEPFNGHAQYILGMAAMYLGHDEAAKSALDAALKVRPNDLTFLMGRAQFAMYTDAPKEAVTYLSQALAADGKNPEVLEMLGRAERDCGEFAQALLTFKTAAELSPHEPRCVAEAAECLERMQKPDDALAEFQKALEIDPKYTVAWLSTARIYQSQKEWDKAIAALRQVTTIDPGDFRTQARIVQLCEAAGKIPERDAARVALFQMHTAGTDAEDSFCREQFNTDKNMVVVTERFDFSGPKAVRYSFNIASPDGKNVEKVVSLGSSLEVTALAREQGKIAAGERMYSLDVYTEDGHDVLKMFTKEPTYEETRDLVKAYLTGTLKLLPATAPASGPATGGKQ